MRFLPPHSRINSPYVPDARFAKKRSLMWTGYKIHLRETCEEEMPRLIPHVATTPAPRADNVMVEDIHTDLQHQELLPREHFLDAGYVSANVLATSQERFGVRIIGPTHINVRVASSHRARH